MKIFLQYAILLGATALVSVCPAGTIRYQTSTAPDDLTRQILSTPIHSFEEGALSPKDIASAIHLNFPQIIEQNVAEMPSTAAKSWLDQLSNAEIEHLAQLYVTANADAGRSGRLLQVMALRLDGVRLGRLARFFGYDEVYGAIAATNPSKLQAFFTHAPIGHPAPLPGAKLRTFDDFAREFGRSEVSAMAGFSPQVSMTFEELYAGFRSMQIGSMAATAAIYEVVQYAGKNLVVAWGAGYGFGSGITYLMQEYTPNFYNNTFVPLVGGSIAASANYVQNLVTTINSDKNNSVTLGNLQSGTIPIFGNSGTVQSEFGNMGGDYGMCYEYEYVVEGGGQCRGYCGPVKQY